jgi:hypothetical protein
VDPQLAADMEAETQYSQQAFGEDAVSQHPSSSKAAEHRRGAPAVAAQAPAPERVRARARARRRVTGAGPSRAALQRRRVTSNRLSPAQ